MLNVDKGYLNETEEEGDEEGGEQEGELATDDMANDSRFVLGQLVRSGIWSAPGDLWRHKHLVLDADSAVTYLYKRCVINHLDRQRSLAGPRRRQPLDYFAATIVNYQEFGQYVKQMLDLFANHSIQLHVVYRGKHMEAPLYGLLPAQLKKNIQRSSEPLDMLLEYSNLQLKSPNTFASTSSLSKSSSTTGGSSHRRSLETYMAQLRPSRANLALNVFKWLVNEHRRRMGKRSSIHTHQAFYSPYPTLAKLARDFHCPVLTNDGDFIIMDVRQGFILFEDFFRSQLDIQNVLTRYPSLCGSTSSISSTASSTSIMGRRMSKRPTAVSPKSPALSDAKSLFQQPARSSRMRFHTNALFLRQHPGLNQALVLHLFPLTTGEFIVVHAKSMTKMRIYDREFKEQDLISVARDLKGQTAAKKYHMAAARLEMVSRYLCTKDPELLTSLLKGEAHRLLDSRSSFDEDYKELFNYYSVAYDFKNRLKLVLKHLTDARQLNYITNCLLERECSAEYLLSLLCCSIGRMSSITYNKSMQFEDLQTRHSALAVLDRGRQLLMALLSENTAHKGEHSAALSREQRDKIAARFKMAALTLVDRQHHELKERILETNTLKVPAHLKRLTLAELATQGTVKKEAVAFMELVFCQQPAGSFVKLAPSRLAQILPAAAVGEPTKQLAVLLNLHRFSLAQAAREDPYFKLNYLSLSAHFELALAQQLIHTAQLGSSKQLADMINRLDLENVARSSFEQQQQHKLQSGSKLRSNSGSSMSSDHVLVEAKRTKSRIDSSKKGKKSEPITDLLLVRRCVRHLVELLNCALESYSELNAFLNYPLPQLNLAHWYNPILLFNLTLYNHNTALKH